MKRIVLSMVCCFCLMACNKGVLDPGFVENPDIRMEMEGKTVFVYDPITCQLGFNKEKRRFIVHTDTMSDYYLLTLDNLPSEVGQYVGGDVTWTTAAEGTKVKKNVTFKVVKLEGDIVWLWSSKNRINMTVRLL